MKELEQRAKRRPVVSARYSFGYSDVKHLRSGGVLEMSFETMVHLRVRLTQAEMDKIQIVKQEKNKYFVYFDEGNGNAWHKL